ncbi:hypothetical protein ACJX0J_007330, partial [Zea mays]
MLDLCHYLAQLFTAICDGYWVSAMDLCSTHLEYGESFFFKCQNLHLHFDF